MTKPLIAVAGRPVDKGGVAGWKTSRSIAVREPYLSCLGRAGAFAAVVDPWSIDSDAEEILRRFDGFLLTGGPDVDPALYGDAREPETYGVSSVRDGFELALIKSALAMELPLLAICRGIQVLNVALGGSLIQHLDPGSVDHGETPDGDYAMHSVKVESGSRLAEAMGAEVVLCASHHHQAIRDLGEGLKPVAWADDGIVEGVEATSGWVVGVQWHPETTSQQDLYQQRLFDSFVVETSRRL